MSEWVIAAIAVFQFLVNIGIILLAGNRTIDERVERKTRDIREDMTERARVFQSQLDALRQKTDATNEYARDYLVKEKIFATFVQDMKEALRRFEERLDTRLDRISEKIENGNGK